MHVVELLRQGRALVQRPARPATVEQRNMRYALRDGFGVGLATGVSTFLSVFLVRLGASAFQVGLLTSMPALTGMILVLPLGQFLSRRRSIVPWYAWSRLCVYSAYAASGVVPFFFAPRDSPLPILIIWALISVPQVVLSICFQVVMGAIVGPARRYHLMSRRWSVLGVVSAITVAIVGGLLDRINFPLNYQVVLIGSLAGTLIAFASSRRLVAADNPTRLAAGGERRAIGKRLRDGLAALRENGAFGRFLLSQFFFQCASTMVLPLFPLYWVREIHAPNAWIGAITMAQSGSLLIGYFAWAALSRRGSRDLVLYICMFGLGCYPLLTALTSSLPALVLYAVGAGVFGAGIDLVLFDILMSTCPPHQITTYVAIYQLIAYVAALGAPLVGTFVAGRLGLPAALLLGSGLYFVAGVLFVLLRVGKRSDAGRAVPL
jgi:Major Facilitator Superfamily